MILRPLVPFVGVAFSISIWLYRARLRKLPPPQEIIANLHPKESKHLEKYITDPIEDDPEFYRDFGGWDGFKRKRANAKAFVHLCQSLPPGCDINPEDIDFMANRAMLILLQRVYSLPEALARRYKADLPHSCARTTAQLYWEMERRVNTLCGGEILDQLHTML